MNPETFNAEERVSRIYPFIRTVFDVYEIQNVGEVLYFYGTPKKNAEHIIRTLWYPFKSLGLEFTLKYELGEHVLTVSSAKEVKEKTWLNFVLLGTTIFTTMLSGALMFGVDLASEPLQVFRGLPFTLAIMAVLGSHEMAHYVAARYHGMKTSLPYFIPFPAFIGTLGAIIKYRGPIPSRKALFDVGVSGPLVGLLVSIVVTVIGLSLKAPQVSQQPNTMLLDIGLPPLFLFIQKLMGATGEGLHPIAFAGWVGMFVTFLNLLPAGQLDGGHVLRAMLGKKSTQISILIPQFLLLVGIYVNYWMNENGMLWIFWAFFLWIFVAVGHPAPLQDDLGLDRKRFFVGILTFVLGMLCFTLVPFKIIN